MGSNKNYTSFISKNNSIVLSTDSLNLTDAKTKKDMEVASSRILGVEFDISDRKVKKTKKKKMNQL